MFSMNARNRLRPLMGIKEVFSIPQIILVPALCLSCVIIPLSLLTDQLPKNTIMGAIVAVLVFGVLTIYLLVIPAIYALILKQKQIEGTATIVKKEKRSRTVYGSTSDFGSTYNYYTIEFTPQGASTPIQIGAEVGTIASRLTEGKTVKIVYASSNPRILKFAGE